jgi:hypothetical protein
LGGKDDSRKSIEQTIGEVYWMAEIGRLVVCGRWFLQISYLSLIGNLSAVHRQNNGNFCITLQPLGAIPGGFHLAGNHIWKLANNSKEIICTPNSRKRLD